MTLSYRFVCICLVLVLLSGCGGVPFLGQSSPPTPTPETDAAATVDTAVAATVAARQDQPGTQAPEAPTAAPTSAAGGQGASGRFAIDERASSDRSVLQNVELIIYSADATADTLALRIAFENNSDESFSLVGGFSGNDLVLRDADGTEYEPIEVSDTLRSSIDPQGGFAPGAANVGTVTFPRPTGDAPYELVVPEYDPIAFQLDTPLDEETFALAEGTYPIDQGLRSNRDALVPIELRVQSLDVQADTLIFEVAFVNTGRQGYDLVIGPDGSDARLLDAEQAQYEPAEVSPSLAESIAPEDGWDIGEAYTGTLTFVRPDAPQALRFVFPEYDALTIRLDADGIAAAEVTSPSGGAPQPTATPSAENVALDAIEDLLAQQADALLAGNPDAYLATFDPASHDQQQQILARMANVPIESYELEIAPDTSVTEADLETGVLEQVLVRMTYALRGIDPATTFIHDLNYSFARSDDTWRVSAVEIDENPPFWYTGDLVLSETEHFLLFARPELEGELPMLAEEVETAYTTLAQRGLPLEQRYVTYFTASQDDFSELTGRTSDRVLGIALSHYGFEGEEVTVSSYAFYINGEAFTIEENLLSDADRQTTITHELVHLVLAPVTRPYTPPWVAEGAAVYYSEDLGPEQRERLVSDGQLEAITLADLTRAERLGEHDFLGEQVGYEYVFSGETFAYLIETFGEETTLEFYRAYADVPAVDVREQMPRFGSAFAANAVFADLREQLTAEAVQRFFNTSLEQLDADVKAWLRPSP